MTPPLEAAPLPPADLAARPPLEVKLRKGDIIHRFFTAIFDPLYFDRGRDGRLNAPDGSFGVLYAAKEPRGAFAETFLRVPGRTQLPTDLLSKKAYVTLQVLRPLRLVKLAGSGLARVGATAQVVHGGKPYDAPQSWSAALHVHPNNYDGIAYNARHDDESLCYALFDRARRDVRETGRETNLDQDWFWELADPYGIGLPPA